MENENTPNLNRILNTGDNLLGVGMSGLGCFTVMFFLVWPFLAVVYLIGTKFFGLPG